MENASKALLIAGAILLVIAIIAIAMGILNQGQEVTNRVSGQFDTLTIQSHNSQFTSYSQLDRLTKSQLIDLVSKVKSSNENNSKLAGTYDNEYTVQLQYGANPGTGTFTATNSDTVKAQGDTELAKESGAADVYAGCTAALADREHSFWKVDPVMSTKGIIVELHVYPK